MKKRTPIVALLIAVALLAATTLTFGLMQKKLRPKTWSTESPSKTYRVSFTGVSAPPSWPFTETPDLENREVKVTVSKNGTTLVDRAGIYEGDAYDSSFSDLYSDTEWLSEATLHLWKKQNSNKDSRQLNEISIRNESRWPVRYLYVKAGKTNLFLLFDMQPATSVTIRTRLEHWEDLVGCEGKFDDHDFPYRSADYSLSPAKTSMGHYNIIVTQEGCSVTRED